MIVRRLQADLYLLGLLTGRRDNHFDYEPKFDPAISLMVTY
jgi:hypothetical protein